MDLNKCVQEGKLAVVALPSNCTIRMLYDYMEECGIEFSFCHVDGNLIVEGDAKDELQRLIEDCIEANEEEDDE